MNATSSMPPWSGVLYDCETARPVLKKDEERVEGIEYADSFARFDQMGISVICAYDFQEKRYRVFLEDNFEEFAALVASREEVLGFNSLRFDDKLCAAHGIEVQTTYDLFDQTRTVRKSLAGHLRGLGGRGEGLGVWAYVNLNAEKSGSGKDAPIWWQKGKRGRVIDYCLQDVTLCVELLERGFSPTGITLLDPKSDQFLALPLPGAWAKALNIPASVFARSPVPASSFVPEASSSKGNAAPSDADLSVAPGEDFAAQIKAAARRK